MTYLDRYGRIHDQPTNNGEPSSDNGFYYSAIYVKLGGTVNLDPVAFEECVSQLKRHPKSVTNRDQNIPISRDEIISLEYLKPGCTNVISNGWLFNPPQYKIPKFNLLKLLVQAFHCINPYTLEMKHRNTFWQQSYDQIYRFAFSVPWSDRHTILRINGRYNPWWHLMHIILNRKTDNRSGRQLYWFKTGKDIEGVMAYHNPDSPIAILARAKK